MKKLITIFFILLLTEVSYSQLNQSVIRYIIIDSTGQEKTIPVSNINALPVQFNGNIEMGNIVIDTNAQHYNTVVLLQQMQQMQQQIQQLSMNFTNTISIDIDTIAIALPSITCQQATLSLVFDYADNYFLDDIVWVGSAGLTKDNGIQLKAGDAVTFHITNLNQIYVLGTYPKMNGLRIIYSGRH